VNAGDREIYFNLVQIFFFFGQVTNNFIKKVVNPSTLGMYCGGKNNEPKLQ